MVATSRIVDTAELAVPAAETARPEFGATWDTVQRARHLGRPHTLAYIGQLCSDFVQLRGDRSFGEDQAIVGGVGRTALGTIIVLGHQKGSNTRENLDHHFAMPNPEGYRKAVRLMRHAEKFGFPVVCFLDTPGAQPWKGAEERGQAQSVAACLSTMASLRVPTVAVVVGEGASGGALAIGLADRLLMLENAIFGVASPEASAAILWSNADLARDAAAAMKITARDLRDLGIVDEVLAEPPGGAHMDVRWTVEQTCNAILRHLGELQQRPVRELLDDRYARYRGQGCYQTLGDLL